MTYSRFFGFVTIASLCVTQTVAFAQTGETVLEEGFGTILIEQKSEHENMLAQWTLIKPGNKKVISSNAVQKLTSMEPGLYTIIVTPPEGARSSVNVYQDGELDQENTKPQATFILKANTTVGIVIQNNFVFVGVIAVNSQPLGLNFTMRGPNDSVYAGTTPASFLNMPEGLYSAQFEPIENCIDPKPVSDRLVKASRINLSITVACDGLEHLDQEQTKQKSLEYVTASVDGSTLIFTDSSIHEWYAPFVYTAVKTKVMSGYRDAEGNPNGLYGPGDLVTIGQLAKIAHALSGISEKKATLPPQNLLARNQWYEQYIASAEELFWEVYQDKTVNLDRPATRAEVVSTLLQALDVPRVWPKGILFHDVSPTTQYAASIETAALDGLVSGYTDSKGNATGEFGPNNPVNRAEIAKIISQAIALYTTIEE